MPLVVTQMVCYRESVDQCVLEWFRSTSGSSGVAASLITPDYPYKCVCRGLLGVGVAGLVRALES
jgi:hypothetical protein